MWDVVIILNRVICLRIINENFLHLCVNWLIALWCAFCEFRWCVSLSLAELWRLYIVFIDFSWRDYWLDIETGAATLIKILFCRHSAHTSTKHRNYNFLLLLKQVLNSISAELLSVCWQFHEVVNVWQLREEMRCGRDELAGHKRGGLGLNVTALVSKDVFGLGVCYRGWWA